MTFRFANDAVVTLSPEDAPSVCVDDVGNGSSRQLDRRRLPHRLRPPQRSNAEGLRKATTHKVLEELASQAVFVALFETLNWLDALIDRPEAAPLVEASLGDALKFVRGRVHHRWAESHRVRDDVSVPLSLLGSQMGPAGPTVVSDWCWKRLHDIPGGRHDRRERQYDRLLAGQQTRSALDDVARVAGSLLGSPS